MKKHLNLFALLVLLICGNTVATAQPLLKDDFTDSIGTVLTAAGWSLSGTSVINPITIVAGTGITFSGYSASGIGNAVAMKNTGQDVYKSFTTVNSGSVYLSFLMNVSAALTGDYFIAVSPPSVQFNYYARLHLKSTTGGYLVGISKSNEVTGGSQYGTTTFSLNTTYLVVMKYTFVPAATAADTLNDPISVYVLPSGASLIAEPATPELNAYVNATKGDAIDLGYVTLRQGSATAAPTMTIDGIRVDTTWAGVIGKSQAVATFSPTSLDFKKVIVGTSVKDSISILNNGGDTLKITSVTSNYSVFVVTPSAATILPLATQKFYVTFTPTGAVASSAKISFASNAATSPDSVMVTGSGTPAGFKEPIFTVTPSSLDFKGVLKNQSKTDSVTVKNTGTDSLFITAIASTNGVFTVTPTTARLDTMATAKFFIMFTPTTGGLAAGLIVFTDNTAEGTDTVKVSGSGLALGSIKSARLAANGTEVLFEGMVTRAKGAFTYMQDTSAGIVVRQTSGAWFDSVTTGGLKGGDKVRVYGKTSEYNSLKQINTVDLYSFERISRSNSLPNAQLVNLKELVTNGENYEAEFVKVISVSITGSGTFTAATTYAITDPSDASNAVALRIPNAADSDVDGMPFITVATFTGVVGQFSSSDPVAGYQLMAVDLTDLKDNTLSVQELASGIPAAYTLYNNYPNPFNPSTTIKFGVPEASNVTLKIYDIVGREVATLVNDQVAAGYHDVSWDASAMASGVYLYRITATSVRGQKQSFTQGRKLVLMK
jgi:uncharacterized protein YdeI (BOF family)